MSWLSKPFKIAGRAATRVVDVRVDRWLSLGMLKEQTAALVGMAKNTFKPKTTEIVSESFEEAVQRFALTPEDVLRKQNEFWRLAVVFCTIAVLLFGYAVYMAFSGVVLATLVTLVLTVYALVQSFSFHFWYFQISQQRLGCTFQEWWAHYVERT